MQQTDIFSKRIRRLAVGTGIASALALFPIFFLLYPALLIVGGMIQPRYPTLGKWFVWVGAANLWVVVIMYDAMMSPHPWRQPKSPVYMVVTFWAATVLLIWCSVEFVVDGLKRMRARRSLPPVEPRPVSLGVWILAGVLSLFVGRNAAGWVLEPSWRQHSDIFYLLGVTVVQAVLVVSFDISLLRRVVKLMRAPRAQS
ncbi:MAG: hypothetical protein WBW53_13600 [Terriglobales bacterium]